ncbi:MAG: hypothetical protein KF852_19510, partial [Saprospiraceae bacterium]|nr:hypothetical protein [Saprospiraceae bacterium]
GTAASQPLAATAEKTNTRIQALREKQIYITKNHLTMKKTKTRQELAAEYGISRKTLARRIKAVGLEFSLSRGVLLPADIMNVYRTLGFPEKMSPEERTEWNEELNKENSI